VTAVVVPELEEPDDVPEVEEPAVEELGDLPAVDATFAVLAAAAFASAGSLPVTSCTKILPELARNIAVAIATTRVRIALIRRLRARSRSATRPFAPDSAVERGVGRSAAGSDTASGGGAGELIVTSSQSAEMLHTDSPAPLATP
jgi:hypothetical protein